jgi:hypothetical protein
MEKKLGMKRRPWCSGKNNAPCTLARSGQDYTLGCRKVTPGIFWYQILVFVKPN